MKHFPLGRSQATLLPENFLRTQARLIIEGNVQAIEVKNRLLNGEE
jgi:hypothetical protein